MTKVIRISPDVTRVIRSVSAVIEDNFSVNRFDTQTSNGAQKLVDTIAIPTGQTAAYEIVITGQDIASSENFVAKIFGSVRNFGGTVTALDDGFDLDINHSANAGTWDVSIAANDTTKSLDVFVTGEIGRIITWDVRIQTTLKDI